jgi:hypothetical protein
MIVVEVLDRRGAVRRRVWLRAFPATLGRDYRSDLVLDDRYIDPTHARLERDGQGGMVLTDLGSTNGMIDQAGGRVGRVILHSGTEVRLGRTGLRFIDPGQAVAPTLREGHGPSLMLGQSAPRDLALVMASVAVLLFSQYTSATGRERLTNLVGGTLGMLVAVAVWASGWALFSRITQHRFRFREHFLIAAAALLVLLLCDTLGDYLKFLWPGGIDWGLGVSLLGLGVVVAGLAAHLSRVSAMSRLHRWLWSAAVVSALGVIMALADDDGDSGLSDQTQNIPLKPVGASWIPAETPAAYLKRVGRLQAIVDSLAIRMASRDSLHRE